MRRLPILLLALLVALPAPSSAQEAGGGCQDVFPGVVFEIRRTAGPVMLLGADLTQPLVDRFARDIEPTAAAIQRDMGGLDGVEICLFPDALPIDAVALGWPEGQRLRAASFTDEQALALSTQQARLVKPAAILGLAHQAQWAVSDGGYPAAFGSAVGQWYRSQAAGQLEQDRSILRYARIIGSLSEPIPWAEGDLEAVWLWAPQFQDSAIGDFVGYAVAEDGVGILADPDPAALARLDEGWRELLLVEARGSERPSNDWIAGLAVVVGGVLLALSFPLVGWWRSRRAARKRRAEAPRSEDSETADPERFKPAGRT